MKRRRLNDGRSGLSKPFKSPLKTDIQSGEDSRAGSVATSKDQHRENDPAAMTNRNSSNTLPPTAPIRRSPPNYSSPSQANRDPQFLALQKQHSALLLQLTQLRQSIDTSQQALKIASSSSHTELETLIIKWKLASREAAEEIFRSAKDRVNSMGGVGAWQLRSKKKLEECNGESLQPDLGVLSEEQREQMEIQKEELEAEKQKYAPETAQEVEERDDDVSTD